jgi:thioesterase domain-containing protein
VLNLRHLANLVGAERPFWGLQARGLYGDHQPHEAFEEMAADYLTEVRSVRPHGPYLLGGFSGGGITAYEMARQLRAAGEEVALLVLLDTPLPKASPLSAHEKALIHWQRLTRKGPGYLAQWAKNRVQWELGRLARRFQVKEEHRPSDFHSDAIEAAFRRALGRYELVPQPLEVTLFRPKLDRSHVLGKGRVANAERELVYHDNGWTPWVSTVAVHEVPGDHDSMVLEPNVRVLAARLRGIIEDVEDERGEERDVRRSRAS